jgi:hypothetical protein
MGVCPDVLSIASAVEGIASKAGDVVSKVVAPAHDSTPATNNSHSDAPSPTPRSNQNTGFDRSSSSHDTGTSNATSNALRNNRREHQSAHGDGIANKNLHGRQDFDTKFDDRRKSIQGRIATLQHVQRETHEMGGMGAGARTEDVNKKLLHSQRQLRKANALDILETTAHTWKGSAPKPLEDLVDKMEDNRFVAVPDAALGDESTRDAEYVSDEDRIRLGTKFVNNVLDAADESGAVDVDSGVITNPDALEHSDSWAPIVGRLALVDHETEHAVQDDKGLIDQVQEENMETLATAGRIAHVVQMTEGDAVADAVLANANKTATRNEVSTLEVPAYQGQARLDWRLDAPPSDDMWNTINNDGSLVNTGVATSRIIHDTMPGASDSDTPGRWTTGGDSDDPGRWTTGGDEKHPGRWTTGGDANTPGRWTTGGDADTPGRWTTGGDADTPGRWTTGGDADTPGRWTTGGDADTPGRWTTGGGLNFGGLFDAL